MATKKIVGIALIVAGLGIAFWGYRMSGSVGSQLSQAFSGSPTDKVMAFHIGGAVCLAVGLLLAIKK